VPIAVGAAANDQYLSTTVKNMPQGSYWRSCTNITIAGNKLSATCQTLKGT
jgi:hypothetical protein